MKNNSYLLIALVLSVAMLVGCRSISSGGDEVAVGIQSGTEPTADIFDAEDDQSVANEFARELIDTWVNCTDVSRIEYVFSVDSYTLKFGSGNCDRFESAFDTLEAEGSYSWNGKATTSTGRTYYIMGFTVEGAHTSATPTTDETPQYQFVFINEEDQLFLSRATENVFTLGSIKNLNPYYRN